MAAHYVQPGLKTLQKLPMHTKSQVVSHTLRYTGPFKLGLPSTKYQLAKLRILEFYHDFLDRFVDCKDFELIQMDTDSLYFALSANKLEEVVKSELQTEFENSKKDWLAWDAFSSRTPGLFKLEFEGYRAIALCSKCYFVDGEKKSKYSNKGMSVPHNSLTWGRYKAALEGNIDRAENRGFRLRHGQMTTYNQMEYTQYLSSTLRASSHENLIRW